MCELTELVVKENYKHHVATFSSDQIKEEIDAIYKEELSYADNSIIFVVRNLMGKIILNRIKRKSFHYRK